MSAEINSIQDFKNQVKECKILLDDILTGFPVGEIVNDYLAKYFSNNGHQHWVGIYSDTKTNFLERVPMIALSELVNEKKVYVGKKGKKPAQFRICDGGISWSYKLYQAKEI